MALMLGIDTGGTYTDAVLHDPDAPHPGILAKAKALTTRHDLSIGIGGAIDQVLPSASTPVSLVSISTTLATNALVEGQGGRVCLILIGFEKAALTRAGLGEALGNDPVVFVKGGHTPTGDRQAPLDTSSLQAAVEEYAPQVDAFAVIAFFGTRDPVDEIVTRDIITGKCNVPVTCGHDLAAKLNGPKRALTAVLNARLIGMIANLITATQQIMITRRIEAPLMLVRGDGSLVSADFARHRPIETILSGPAASLIGAAHLTGQQDAVVSDIGGTTTDIAVLQHGQPALSAEGAVVGGHHTMVEAVAMTTHGLGGDSEVRVDDGSMTPRVMLGPRRLVPVSLLARDYSDQVHSVLDTQLQRSIPAGTDACFALRSPLADTATGLSEPEQKLLVDIPPEPVPLSQILRTRLQNSLLRRLVSRGVVILSGLTPTDAAEVLGLHAGWDCEAAMKAMQLVARQRDAAGRAIAEKPEQLANLIHRTLHRRSAEMLLDVAIARDGVELAAPSLSPLARAALSGHRGVARIDIGLDMPLIGLGASASVYYPAIAGILGTDAIIPEDAGVANAIGAVVGQVRIAKEAVISQPSDGLFRVHLGPGSQDFRDLQVARAHAVTRLQADVQQSGQAAGALDIEMSHSWEDKVANVEGTQVFVEATLRFVGTGRPRLGPAAS